MAELLAGDARATIGERLREARHRRDLTLAQASQLTRVSVSTLSKLENLQVSPSFDVIMRISQGFDISLEDLVTSGGKQQIVGRRAITRRGDGVTFSTAQYGYKVHATDLIRKHMVPLEMRIMARTVDDFEQWGCHPGEEYVFVIEGAIEVHTELYSPARLIEGESAYFDSSMPHVYISIGPKDARVLSVSYDPELGQSDLSVY